MKKLYLLILIMLHAFMLAQTAVPPAVGDGTVGNPYQIASLENLYWIEASDLIVPVPARSQRLSSHYLQTADINALSTDTWNPDGQGGYLGWDPIGDNTVNFTGTYNGGYFAIIELYARRLNEDYIGLFSVLSTGAAISNIVMTGFDITGRSYTGSLSGMATGASLTGCSSTGTVTGASSKTGGLTGYIHGSGNIDRCSYSGTVIGTIAVGGIAGETYFSYVNNSQSSGVINASGNFVGGIVGYHNFYSYITKCSSSCTVTGESQVGGLVGESYDSFIHESFSTGNVTGFSSLSGGLVGRHMYSTVSNCYSTGNVDSGGPYGGGFAGASFWGIVEKCYSTGSVIPYTYTGGFLGDTNSTVTACFWDKETSGWISSAAGTGKTTEEMKSLSTFTSAGWDFSTPVWKIVHTVIYPYLSWQQNSELTIIGSENGVDGEYPVGTVLYIIAALPPIYTGSAFFLNWTDDLDTILSEETEFYYTVSDRNAVITANWDLGFYFPDIYNDGTNVILDWDPLDGAAYYQVFSSSDPYGTFTLDESGDFTGTTWTAPMTANKRFYYVVAYY